MANTRNGNTFYIDTPYSGSADELSFKNALVVSAVVTATAANARVVLTDASSSEPIKLDLRVATSGDSKLFYFDECPALFPNGIRPKTLTNAVVTLIITDSRG